MPQRFPPFHVHQIDINIHEGGWWPVFQDGGLTNRVGAHAGVCMCARLSKMQGGRAVIKSQPPPHLHPHQPPVALLPYARTRYDCSVAQTPRTAETCVCVFVCVS